MFVCCRGGMFLNVSSPQKTNITRMLFGNTRFLEKESLLATSPPPQKKATTIKTRVLYRPVPVPVRTGVGVSESRVSRRIFTTLAAREAFNADSVGTFKGTKIIRALRLLKLMRILKTSRRVRFCEVGARRVAGSCGRRTRNMREWFGCADRFVRCFAGGETPPERLGVDVGVHLKH